MGIGIDYALFIVNRHRLGLKAGRDVRDSIVAAMGTSGRAVVFAGITVFIALLGMLVPRLSFLTGMGITAAITVAFSVAASTTLVPALLSLYGHRVLNRRERAALVRDGAVVDNAPRQSRFARLVERRPLLASVAAVALLATLALPAFSLRLGSADAGQRPGRHPQPGGVRPHHGRLWPRRQRRRSWWSPISVHRAHSRPMPPPIRPPSHPP